MEYFQEPGKLLSLLTQMLSGTLVTLEVWFFTLLFALPLGMLICQMRMSKRKAPRSLAKAYILYFRGTPLMLQVLFMFFGVPILIRTILGWLQLDTAFTMDRTFAAILAFILNYAAYFAEIYRGGIQSIPRGQYEAAHVLDLSSRTTFTKVILPQVAKRILPPMGNECITLVKDTALVYAIAITDLLSEAKIAMLRDGTILPFVVAAIFYLVMNGMLTKLLSFAERRFAYYR